MKNEKRIINLPLKSWLVYSLIMDKKHPYMDYSVNEILNFDLSTGYIGSIDNVSAYVSKPLKLK